MVRTTVHLMILTTFHLGCAINSEPFVLFGESDTSLESDKWAVIEYGNGTGTRIHVGKECNYFISDSPRWKSLHWGKRGNQPVRWILDRHDDQSVSIDGASMSWPFVQSADVSKNGELVLARFYGNAEDKLGTTEIYDFATGRPIRIWRNSPLGVRWSNSGEMLAIAREDGRSHFRQSIVLAIRNKDKRIRQWPTRFSISANKPSHASDRTIAVSWSADDKYVAVSSKSTPLSALEPLCMIFPTDGGEPLSIAATNASFIGDREFITNLDSKWDQVAVMRITDDGIEKVQDVKEKYLVGGSDPVSGTYFAWMPPGNYPALRFTLRLALFTEPGGTPDESWGYNVNSTLQLIRKDILNNLIEENSAQPTPSAGSFVSSIE